MLVVGYHFSMNGTAASRHGLVGPLLAEGFVGVALFFVLSGFVLAYSHTQIASKRRFYVARFARIYPLLFLSLLLMLPFAPEMGREMGLPFHWWSVLPSFVLLQSWFPSVTFAVNGPAWTLSVEALFYLLFPLLLPLVLRHQQRWIFWVGILWLASLGLPLLMDYPGLTRGLGFPAQTSAALLRYSLSPPLYLPEFVMGMFAGAHFRSQPQRFGLPAFFCVTVLTVIALRLSVSIGGEVARNGGLALPFVALVYIWAGYRSRVLGSRVAQFGGEISYSIYLLQIWVLRLMLELPPWAHRKSVMIWPLLVVSAITYLKLEKPARLLILGWSRVPEKSKPIPTPVPMA